MMGYKTVQGCMRVDCREVGCSCWVGTGVGIEGDTVEDIGEVGSKGVEVAELHNLQGKDRVVEDKLGEGKLGEEDMLEEGSRAFDDVHLLDHQGLQGHHHHQ